jgi:hypothetical protein
MMFLKPIVRVSLILLALGVSHACIGTPLAIADKDDAAIYEDNLTTAGGLRWGGPKLPYRRTVDIKDSLVNTNLGKVAADRHGINAGTIVDLIFGPYSAPYPGRSVYISLWGSKIEGCFAEMILQYAPTQGNFDAKNMAPKLLELGIGSQLLELPPQNQSEPKLFSQDYTYKVTRGQLETTYSSTWYMTRNVFVVDSTIANILSNAPQAEVRARLTMLDGSKILVPINKETVSSWKTAYGFNPACQTPENLAKQQALAQKPLLSAFQNYSGSDKQIAALDWLQRQIKPSTLAEFANRWRGLPSTSRAQPLRFTDAAKFFKRVRKQEDALTWLQEKIPADVLKEFMQKWS